MTPLQFFVMPLVWMDLMAEIYIWTYAPYMEFLNKSQKKIEARVAQW